MIGTIRKKLVVLLAASVAWSSMALAAEAKRETAGRLKDGAVVEAVTLSNANGVSARILTLGATLQSLIAPGRDGKGADVVLGYDDVSDYEARSNYFGVTVGRFANRIGGARFALDGRTYRLTRNDKANSLHGGAAGFDKRNWRIVSVAGGPTASVTLAHVSPDGDQGYPGRLDVTVTYSLDEAGALGIAFEARTTKPTVVNLTNHALFNMAGEGAPEGAMLNRLTIPATAYTPVDAGLIPTGELKPVAGGAFDFRAARAIAQGLRDGRDPQIGIGQGYDHNCALTKGVTATP